MSVDHEAMVGILTLEAAPGRGVRRRRGPRDRRGLDQVGLAERGILGTGVLWFERDGRHPRPPSTGASGAGPCHGARPAADGRLSGRRACAAARGAGPAHGPGGGGARRSTPPRSPNGATSWSARGLLACPRTADAGTTRSSRPARVPGRDVRRGCSAWPARSRGRPCGRRTNQAPIRSTRTGGCLPATATACPCCWTTSPPIRCSLPRWRASSRPWTAPGRVVTVTSLLSLAAAAQPDSGLSWAADPADLRGHPRGHVLHDLVPLVDPTVAPLGLLPPGRPVDRRTGVVRGPAGGRGRRHRRHRRLRSRSGRSRVDRDRGGWHQCPLVRRSARPEKIDIDRALGVAGQQCGLVFSVFVGSLEQGRDSAVRLHEALGEGRDGTVLVAVDPGGRSLEIVTGARAARRSTTARAPWARSP